jgi:hypothetical protein
LQVMLVQTEVLVLMEQDIQQDNQELLVKMAI